MKIRNSAEDWFLTTLGFLLLAGTSVYVAVRWQALPDQLPAHYNFAGEIDRWGSKSELLIVLAIGWGLWLLMTAVERFPKIWNTGVEVTPENREQVYRILKSMLEIERLLISGVFAFLTMYGTLGRNLPGLFLPVFLLAILGNLIFWLVRLYRL